jgi:solute carrier family 66 (lysosomal lysine-arginine transporter), member 1
MAFLFVWLLGDVANLSGALVTNLAPTAIALAFYFCFADLVLISQCLYYNTLNARRRARAHRPRRHRRTSSNAIAEDGNEADADADDEDEDPEEEQPLLSRRRSSSIGLPGSHRRHTTHIRRSESSNMDALTRIITGEDDTPDRSPWLHNALSLLAVWVVGGAGWFVSYRMGAWDASAPDVGGDEPETMAVETIIGLALGYFSAVCYLCARIPQIIKNYNEKSCEGES